ncbi:MAG: [FeFe] hydrogenase H-cluster maturation GTPase HydF [bacterium]|nr:[FeFe] hydrogenase H-cluster maturation GTPase HydF [bacterium]
MRTTPKSLRLHIGIFGRTNVGKSSFLNMIAGQEVAITSPVPGTTTDVVEKTMELLPIGPIVLLDTAGLDDVSPLGQLRIRKTNTIFARSDIIALIIEPEIWTEFEESIVREANHQNVPLIIVINKIDINACSESFLAKMQAITPHVICCSSIDATQREHNVNAFKKHLIQLCPEDYLSPTALVEDVVPPQGVAVLIIPIDKEAPKGRIILPQVQTIRAVLDSHGAAIVVKESEYQQILERVALVPDIVICDSQVVLKMVTETPNNVRCTTFSILFSRYKGDLIELAKGVCAVAQLQPGDNILIAEACSHHAIEDDIGRVKLPRWLNQYVGGELQITVCSGRDFPSDLSKYKLIIHCGACMITRKEMLFRIHQANEARIPITNYGICIAFVQGVLDRVLAPFPAAVTAYRNEMSKIEQEKNQNRDLALMYNQ